MDLYIQPQNWQLSRTAKKQVIPKSNEQSWHHLQISTVLESLNQNENHLARNPTRPLRDHSQTMLFNTPKQANVAMAKDLQMKDKLLNSEEQATILQQIASTQDQVSALRSTSHEEYTKLENQVKSLSQRVTKLPEDTGIKVTSKMTDLLTKEKARATAEVARVLESQRSSHDDLIFSLTSAVQYKLAKIGETVTSQIIDSLKNTISNALNDDRFEAIERKIGGLEQEVFKTPNDTKGHPSRKTNRSTTRAPAAENMEEIETAIARSTTVNTQKELAIWYAVDTALLKISEVELNRMENAPTVSPQEIEELRSLASRPSYSSSYVFDNIIGNIMTTTNKNHGIEYTDIRSGLVREEIGKADLTFRERRAKDIARCDKLKAKHSKSFLNLYGLLTPSKKK